MLYLLKPTGSLVWTDMPRSIFDLIVEKGTDFDLSNLEWKPTEHAVTDTTVRLALRQGSPVKDGILMDAGPVIMEGRPMKLLNLHLEGEETFDRLEATPSFQVTEGFLESQAPGWKAGSAKSREDVRTSMQRSIEEARADLDLALTQPVKPDVVEHWKALGGYVPA
jgi:hypothetical protein